jgi:hypothetical protein
LVDWFIIIINQLSVNKFSAVSLSEIKLILTVKNDASQKQLFLFCWSEKEGKRHTMETVEIQEFQEKVLKKPEVCELNFHLSNVESTLHV